MEKLLSSDSDSAKDGGDTNNNNDDEGYDNNQEEQQRQEERSKRRRRRRLTATKERIQRYVDHLELSKRVIRTVASNPSWYGNGCPAPRPVFDVGSIPPEYVDD